MSPSTDPSSRPPGIWRCRAIGPDGKPLWLAAVWTAMHGDGEQVDLDETEATNAVGDDALCLVRFDADGGVTSLVVTALAAPKAPPLWFADLPEPEAAPPATSLVAFSGHDVTAGRLVGRDTLRDLPIASGDQVGAVRWFPATGEVDQVYVQPAWRRRSIASALMTACGTLNVVRGGPRIWADGQRTAMGDRLRDTNPWGHWAADLTHLSPPMTPFDER